MAKIRAFTLIELLVVITIIVVLLALLTPALDKAIYQAELLTCATGKRVVAMGLYQYAIENSRRLPPRWAARQGGQPHVFIDTLWDEDDRPYVEDYFLLELLNDPFLPEVDLRVSEEDTDITDDAGPVFTHYNLWWSWRFDNLAAQDRIGSKFTWKDGDTTHAFDILVGDYDEHRHDVGVFYSDHPDSEGLMAVEETDIPGVGTFTRFANVSGQRGDLDLHFAHQDGSVQRLDRVGIEDDDDERTALVPQTAASASTWPLFWHTRLPRN